MKIYPVGAKLFRVGSWTDTHDKSDSHFSQFSECT